MTLSPLSAAHLSFTPVPDQSPPQNVHFSYCNPLPAISAFLCQFFSGTLPLHHLKKPPRLPSNTQNLKILSQLELLPLNSSPFSNITTLGPLNQPIPFLLLFAFTLFRRDLIHWWIMDGWMDRRLSSTMLLFLSLSLSCGKAIVLMQGNMHWRWAQGPPTQSVCLSAAWRISLAHDFSVLYSSSLVTDNPDLYCNFLNL